MVGRVLTRALLAMRKQPAPRWRTTLVAGSVAAADLLTKAWVTSHAATLTASREPRSLLSLAFVRNPGMSWGLGAGRPLLVLVIAGVSTSIASVLAGRATTRTQSFGLAVVVGGALGNLLDRLLHGTVTDWIRLTWYPPAFNVADLAIRGGLLVVAAAYLRGHAHRMTDPRRRAGRG